MHEGSMGYARGKRYEQRHLKPHLLEILKIYKIVAILPLPCLCLRVKQRIFLKK